MSFSKFTEAEGQLIREKFAELMAIAEPRCRNEYEVDTIKKAFEFANEAHKDIRRSSGEPYILHPIEVAKIVVKNIGLGYKSICTGLLHDVCEDTDYTTEDVSSLFG
ncbi:MAG: HD domain-containing protein, partial [Bacteroidales bacterium]|nr:HD domain-containing protein [Bacteroidales bacterium]